jgi:hypothetical protein
MSIKKALDVINAMEADGIIGRYAIAGAIAAYNGEGLAQAQKVKITFTESEGKSPGSSGCVRNSRPSSVSAKSGRRPYTRTFQRNSDTQAA